MVAAWRLDEVRERKSVARWREELRDRRLIARWLISLGGLGVVLMLYRRFLEWVERRPGVVLTDPLLAELPAVDLTWPIFVFVYGGLLGGLAAMISWPRALRTATLAYGLMVVFRTLMMAVVPLDPPPRMILLEDPFIAMFGIVEAPTRDLFFSGHTATLAVIAFCLPRRGSRLVFAAATAAMGAMVLIQHVHYTIDVLVAPFVAFGAVSMARAGERLADQARSG